MVDLAKGAKVLRAQIRFGRAIRPAAYNQMTARKARLSGT
jgi:hypothetical protein